MKEWIKKHLNEGFTVKAQEAIIWTEAVLLCGLIAGLGGAWLWALAVPQVAIIVLVLWWAVTEKK